MTNRADNRIYSQRGMLTVEATFSFTIFFFLMYLFWQCFLWVLFELKVEDSVFLSTSHLASAGYAEREYNGGNTDNFGWIYAPEIYARVPDTITGLNIITCFSEEDGSVEISVYYQVKLMAVILPSLRIPVTQSFLIYPFIGIYDEDKLGKDDENTELEDEEWVYITKSGKVYHSRLSCTYLRANISVVIASEVGNYRNSSGGKYYECELCKNEKKGDLLYIAEYGERYHRVSNCRGIKKEVQTVRKSEVGDKPPCSKCGKE